MSQAIPTRCPIKACKFNKSVIYVERSLIKSHIKHHDYKELQKTAFEHGLIDEPSEKRSVNWFVESLIQFSIIEEKIS